MHTLMTFVFKVDMHRPKYSEVEYMDIEFTPLETGVAHLGEATLKICHYKYNRLTAVRVDGYITNIKRNSDGVETCVMLGCHAHTIQMSAHENAETLLMMRDRGIITDAQVEEIMQEG